MVKSSGCGPGDEGSSPSLLMQRLLHLIIVVEIAFFAYSIGRRDEAEFSLDAYQAALDADVVRDWYQENAARNFGVAERSVRVCLMREDAKEDEG